jgi:chorismate mutase
MLANVRAEIQRVTDEIVGIVSTGRGSAKATSFALELMDYLSEQYGVPVEDYAARLSKLLSEFKLTKTSLDRLRSLIVERCDLSLRVAELKLLDNPQLPRSRGELIWSLTNPEVEAGLVKEALLKSDARSLEERARITDLMQLLFDLSKEVQVSRILRSGV